MHPNMHLAKTKLMKTQISLQKNPYLIILQ